MHDKGNEENLFDRVDYQLSTADSIHLNLGLTRSWFQTPNSYDNLQVGMDDPFGNPLTPTDQRSQIKTFNIAPTWTRVINPKTVFNLGGWVRRDAFNYYPSDDPFSDIGPPNLQQETIAQHRTLANTGVRSDLSYVKGDSQHQGKESLISGSVSRRKFHARNCCAVAQRTLLEREQ